MSGICLWSLVLGKRVELFFTSVTDLGFNFEAVEIFHGANCLGSNCF